MKSRFEREFARCQTEESNLQAIIVTFASVASLVTPIYAMHRNSLSGILENPTRTDTSAMGTIMVINFLIQQLEYKAQVTYTLLTTERRTFQGSSYDWMDDVIVNEGQDQAQAIDTTDIFNTNS